MRRVGGARGERPDGRVTDQEHGIRRIVDADPGARRHLVLEGEQHAQELDRRRRLRRDADDGAAELSERPVGEEEDALGGMVGGDAEGQGLDVVFQAELIDQRQRAGVELARRHRLAEPARVERDELDAAEPGEERLAVQIRDATDPQHGG